MTVGILIFTIKRIQPVGTGEAATSCSAAAITSSIWSSPAKFICDQAVGNLATVCDGQHQRTDQVNRLRQHRTRSKVVVTPVEYASSSDPLFDCGSKSERL